MKIQNEDVLAADLGISTAPPDSPTGEPRPAAHDFMVYRPSDPNGMDVTNQHVQVIALEGDTLLATWTCSCLEGGDNQHIVVSRSEDAGRSWSEPLYIDGPRLDGNIASWSFPVYAPKTGRVYLFYNKQQGFVDFHHQWTGQLWYRFSENAGRNWSGPCKHLRIEPDDYSHADGDADPNWIVFQPPILSSRGELLVGFTQIGTRALSDGENWPSECRFLRFDNILEEPDPTRLTMSTLPDGGRSGLRMRHPNNPMMSFLQEPALCELPDGRLFSTMRTLDGYVAYSVSADGGTNWQEADYLRYEEGGEKVANPVVPCPIYRIPGNRYILIFYNNRGEANQGRTPLDWCRNRVPAWFSIGRPCAGRQPLRFGKPVVLADNDRIPISRKQLTEIATYPTVLNHKGETLLFFPDRKHYVLGRVLQEDLLAQSV